MFHDLPHEIFQIVVQFLGYEKYIKKTRAHYDGVFMKLMFNGNGRIFSQGKTLFSYEAKK